MATKAGSLVIDLEARVARLETDMTKATNIVNRNLKSVNKIAGQAKAALAGLAGAIGVRAIVGSIVEYERLEASLRTVTGSTAAATREYARLKQFTSETPFQLQEVTGAFIKLKALGLDPSTAALSSYGNTASAMGKDLNQFIEAVADAATGEFERLKEFGVKAKQQGDQVSFTFQGVTTTVQKKAGEIEAYLRKIGETQFAGAMNEQMKTLGGTFSNLGDAGFQLAEALGKAGLSSAIKTLASITKDLATAITASVSPTLEAASAAGSLNAFYKRMAFVVFKVKQEFADLGDYIGAVMATLDLEVGSGFFAKFDAIWDERVRKRDQIERETEEFVARMQGLFREAAQDAPPPSTTPAQPSTAITPAKSTAVTSYRDPYGMDVLNEQVEQERLRVEEERATANQERTQERLALLHAMELEVKGAHYENMRNLEDEYLESSKQALSDYSQFQAMSWQQQAKTILGEMVNMTAGVAQHNKTLFKINKVAAIAQATVAAYQGISKTLAAYPYPWNIGLAALHGAAAFAQISAIKSTSFAGGGGGTTPSSAGSAPTINDAPVPAAQPSSAPARQVNISVRGSVFDGNTIRELIEGINEQLGDGVALNLDYATA